MKEIKLTQNQVALVDDKNHEWLNQFKWIAARMGGRWHAVRSREGGGNNIPEYMSRFIVGATDGEIVDHIDRDGLNNLEDNLRKCTRQQSSCNRVGKSDSTSRFKGVSWENSRNKWHVSICANGKRMMIGRFDCETEAAGAYDRKAQELHGEFAYLNEGLRKDNENS